MQPSAGCTRPRPGVPHHRRLLARSGRTTLERRQHSTARGGSCRMSAASYGAIRHDQRRPGCGRPARQEATALSGLSSNCRRLIAASRLHQTGGTRQQRGGDIRRSVRFLCTNGSPQQGRLRLAGGWVIRFACSSVAARPSCEGVLLGLCAAQPCLWCQAAEPCAVAIACGWPTGLKANVAAVHLASDRSASSKRTRLRSRLMWQRTLSWRLLSARLPTPAANSPPSGGRPGRVGGLPGSSEPRVPHAASSLTSYCVLLCTYYYTAQSSACCRSTLWLASHI